MANNFMEEKVIQEGLTFDDVLLVPEFSSVLPAEVETKTSLTKSKEQVISLHIPLLSAAMDTVTEARMAIAMAREGGIGIIHRNLNLERQVEEVDKVKRSESGMIKNPITLLPTDSIKEAIQVMETYHISGVPITDPSGILVGILTNRDLRFEKKYDQPIEQLMTKEHLITASVGTSLEEAKEILHKHKIEKLPIVDSNHRLRGLITVKDIQKKVLYPNASKDSHGRLLAGAAVGVRGDAWERLKALVKAEVDVIVVDTAHGHSKAVIEMVRAIVKEYPGLPVIAGNVATGDGTLELIKAGAHAIKVGMGPGSICTTRVVAGVGVPQITAIHECAQVAKKYNVSIIADGGITSSGDITKALVAGADVVMIGSLFAGTDESPGDIIIEGGQRYKEYRGMGSIGAMKLYSKDRYFQQDVEEFSKLVPEGIEGRVPYKGLVSKVIHQLTGGLRSGMGYVGAPNITELKGKRFIKISNASLQESHPHGLSSIYEAPNYFGKI